MFSNWGGGDSNPSKWNRSEVPEEQSDKTSWLKRLFRAGHRWLTSVILATQEAETRKTMVQSQSGQIVRETLSWKTLSQKIGLVEWLKVKTLSSSPSTSKKKKIISAIFEVLESKPKGFVQIKYVLYHWATP
jgi:hypothetical protein